MNLKPCNLRLGQRDKPIVMLNPTNIPAGYADKLVVECTPWGAEYAPQVVRGLIVTSANVWISGQPVYQDGRYGFVFPGSLQIGLEAKFAAQVMIGGELYTGVWQVGNPSNRDWPIAGEVGTYAGELKKMWPDYSRVPLTLSASQVWGVSLENWMWMEDPFEYSRMVAGHGLTCIARMLGGSSDTPDGTDCTGKWFYDLDGIADHVQTAVSADRAAGLLSWWWIHSGNSGIICAPQFDDVWIAKVGNFFQNVIGPANIVLCGPSEPWHPKAGRCQPKILDWHKYLQKTFTGMLGHNYNASWSTGWLRVDHHQHPRSFQPDTVREGDSPGVIDWITNNQPQGFACSERVYEDALVSRRNECGYLLYDYRWNAWRRESWDHAALAAVGRGKNEA